MAGGELHDSSIVHMWRTRSASDEEGWNCTGCVFDNAAGGEGDANVAAAEARGGDGGGEGDEDAGNDDAGIDDSDDGTKDKCDLAILTMESNVFDGIIVDDAEAAAADTTTSRQRSRINLKESRLSGGTAAFCNLLSCAIPATLTNKLIAKCSATLMPPEHHTAPNNASTESDTFLGDTP